MKAVIQRVNKASVTVDNTIISKIDSGLLVLLGIHETDTQESIEWMSKKILNLRIFNDPKFPSECSVKDLEKSLLIVSQFTLYANCQKGNRPSFIEAAKPPIANAIYTQFIDHIKSIYPHIQCGQFGADMTVSLENDGPFTILLET